MKLLDVAGAALIVCITTAAYAQQATAEEKEIEAWKKYVIEKHLKSIDIPFAFSTGAVNVAGVMHLRDPFDDSSAEAIAAGAVIGQCELDRNRTDCRIYDPTGNVFRFVMELSFPGRELRGRVDTRQWDGRWSEGSWFVAWRQ
jgi:hypothetical protein